MPIISGAAGGGLLANAFANGNAGGDLTTTSATFVDMGLSTSIAAAVNDILIITFTGNMSNATANLSNFVKVVATTSSTAVIQGTILNGGAGAVNRWTLSTLYKVVSGDISSGSVALKMQFASGTAGQTFSVSNTVAASAPQLSVINLKH